jgi:GT2 family glycosyltransferase/glycosyltransferase involved in cell wall biosynthesis
VGALSEPRLRVVVLTYGTSGVQEALLASLLGEGIAPEQILVVHNPSQPGEPDPAVPAGCEVLRAPSNLGYAGGMNLGIERQLAAGCDLLLLLTHDARLRPGSLERLLAAAAAHPEFGVLGPGLVWAGTDEPYSLGGRTRSNGSTFHLTETPVLEDGIAPCDWLDGGTLLIRAEALAATGGFDERFWSYCEESDLCLRISRAGFRIGVVPAALADQAPGGTNRPGAWAYLMTRNGIAYAYRAAGIRGAAWITVRAYWETLEELARAAVRLTPLRSGSVSDPWATAVGTLRGVADFFLRRWGPPPSLPGSGDVSNVGGGAEAPAAAERPRVLHLGPDVRGGMTAVMRGLLRSPLSDRYEMEMVATHTGLGVGRRLGVFARSQAYLVGWSLRRRGRIVHIHATVRGSMYRKALCVLLAKALGRRVVLHVHSGPGDVTAVRARLGPLSVALFRAMFRRADVVLAVSEASAAALERGYGATGIVVVPNAAPRLAEPVVREAGERPGVLFLGGFANPVKGGEELLAALAEPAAPDVPVVLAGPGELPERAGELKAMGREIEWRGWLEEDEKEQLMREAEIFVLPSTSEGLPMALLEAMAYEQAIVATAVGGVPDVLGTEDDAIVVPPGDTAALADGLARLAGDPELRRRLGAAAAARARRLGDEQVTDRLDRIYRELLA